MADSYEDGLADGFGEAVAKFSKLLGVEAEQASYAGTLSEIVDAGLAKERARCKAVALKSRHPKDKEWNWGHGHTSRSKFYQNHIVHAWRQAGIKIADAIDALPMREPLQQSPEDRPSDDPVE